MPNKVNITAPPMLTGTAEQKINTLYSYLYQLHERLNLALNCIDAENLSEGVNAQLAGINALADQLNDQETGMGGRTAVLNNDIRVLSVDTERKLRELAEEQNASNVLLSEDINASRETLQKMIAAAREELESGINTARRECNMAKTQLQEQIDLLRASLGQIKFAAGSGTLTNSSSTTIKAVFNSDRNLISAEFTQPPIVIANFAGTGANVTNDPTATKVYGITKDSCTILSSSSTSRPGMWFAIGI